MQQQVAYFITLWSVFVAGWLVEDPQIHVPLNHSPYYDDYYHHLLPPIIVYLHSHGGERRVKIITIISTSLLKLCLPVNCNPLTSVINKLGGYLRPPLAPATAAVDGDGRRTGI